MITLSEECLVLWNTDLSSKFWKHRAVELGGRAFAFEIVNDHVVIAYQDGSVQHFSLMNLTFNEATQILGKDHGLKLKDFKTDGRRHVFTEEDGSCFMMMPTATQEFKVAANIYTAFLVEKDGFKNPRLKSQKVILMDQD